MLAVCAVFAAQPSAYPQRNAKPHVAPTCGSIGKTSGCNRTAGREDRFTAGVALAPLSAKSSGFGRCGGKAGQSRGVVRAPRRSQLPAVRAVWSFKRGVTERGKIAPVGSQFEKSPPFQGKRWGCTKKVYGKRKKQQVQRWVKQLRVYREKQLASLKTCKLPSEKSMLYCTRDSARIRRTIICRNNIDTDPPYWVLLVLHQVEGRFC